MFRIPFFLLISLILPATILAQDQIASAMSAGPSALAADATITDWEGNVLREGSNGWTCLPDRPDSPGTDPWCMNQPWQDFLQAYVEKSEPSVSNVGVAYMLMGDTPVSNVDPYASEKTEDNVWVEDIGAHLMVIVPGENAYAGFSEDPHNGGPWVMWPDTPYAHLMIPIGKAHATAH